MRRLFVSILAAAIVAAAAFEPALPALAIVPHSPVFTDAASPVAVQAGEEFFIALPSNVTTGYSWTATVGDGRLVAYEGNVYQAPSNNGLVGAGGQQLFIFHANRSGTTTIVMNYARSFDAGKPAARTLVFNVAVQ